MMSRDEVRDEATPKPRTGAAELRTVALGFIPLTDCAVLAVAREQGFAAHEGIDLQLYREVSWANIRDKVAFGPLHGAQMLAGMPIAASLGINQIPMPLLVPFCLNRNGNAISVSDALFAEMSALADLPADAGPAEAGIALARVVAEHRSKGKAPLTFGMVYPFSCHNYELRYWLAASGIDPDGDVRLMVVPPPLMVDSLREGHIDGFCVGEPWNSLGVDAGLSRIVVSKAQLWHLGMEKVLGVPATWAEDHPDLLAALIRALDRAAAWADDPANRTELANLLARPQYLDMPAELIARALSGDLIPGPGPAPQPVADFLVLHRDQANRPPLDHALWIYSQMVRWRQVTRRDGDEDAIRATFRPDIYQAALSGQTWTAQPPALDTCQEADAEQVFFDGRTFDPADIDAYIAQAIRT